LSIKGGARCIVHTTIYYSIADTDYFRGGKKIIGSFTGSFFFCNYILIRDRGQGARFRGPGPGAGARGPGSGGQVQGTGARGPGSGDRGQGSRFRGPGSGDRGQGTGARGPAGPVVAGSGTFLQKLHYFFSQKLQKSWMKVTSKSYIQKLHPKVTSKSYIGFRAKVT